MNVKDPYYVLVASDIEDEDGRLVVGADVWAWRYDKALWPLYAKTPNAKVLKAGDHILFYIGGTGRLRQSFVGQGKVKELVDWNHNKGEVDADNWITTSATSAIVLTDLKQFEFPIGVKGLLDKLECAPANKSKWGVIFHGGIRKFSWRDGSVVMRAAKAAANER